MDESSRRGGFTFVEAIIVVALFLVLGATLLVLLMGGQTSYLAADTYLQVQQEARKALDAFGHDMREAVNVSCDFSTCTSNCGNCSSTANRINFQLLRYNDTNGQVTPGSEVADGEFIHYMLLVTTNPSRRDLVRFRSNNVNDPNVGACNASTKCRVIAHNVQSVSFTWDNRHDAVPPGTGTAAVQLETLIRNAFLPGGSTDEGALRTGPLRSQVELRTRWPQP